jgi:hypothetical protein
VDESSSDAAVAILQQGCNIRGSSDTAVVTLQQGCTNIKGLEFTYQVPIFFSSRWMIPRMSWSENSIEREGNLERLIVFIYTYCDPRISTIEVESHV